ncbi:MAG: DUF2480 family protein [Flavobacteriaceae bacterium]|nr:DUF2480 family protein [Bacteroidia bacterium]MBT8287112.1 DUF2480 family protein [Bacteroidia bacterium]NNF73904.1 DUF2480 family protein [Flavobacteriaceae bacterium]NNK71870.1 DUF2480 family protein [Flavobacteriaceae bacterium]
MEEKIVNRVAKSSLITVDLEDYYPEGRRMLFDLKDWLWEGLVLKEKDFREAVKNHDWSQYQDAYVALTCSTDAIVPAWAFMLISINLESYVKRVIMGDIETLETSIYQDIIHELDLGPFTDKPIIIKGCTKKPVPENAYILLTNKLKKVARSIQYGEACSSVPLFKAKKNKKSI